MTKTDKKGVLILKILIKRNRKFFYFLLIILYFDFIERVYTTVYNIIKIKINEPPKTGGKIHDKIQRLLYRQYLF